MMKKFAALAVVAALGLGACQNADYGQKQVGGAILGGVGGALAGSTFGQGKGKVAAVAVGTLLGALLGSEIGKSLDRADQAALDRTTQGALEVNPTGSQSTWRNPDSGHYGTVTPTRTYQAPSGSYCREFTQTVTIGGRTEEAYGTACRQPDGTWQIQNN